MDGLKRRLKSGLQWLFGLAAIFVLALVTEQVESLQAIDAFFAPNRAFWLALTGGMAGVGVVLVIGTQFVVRPPTEAELAEVTSQGVRASFRTLSRSEIEEMRGSRFIQSAAPIALWRRALFRVRGPVAGSGFDVEAPLSAVKGAFRSGAWRRNPIWQRMTLMGGGAILGLLGIVSIPIVLESQPVIKLLCGGALLYAPVRTAWAFYKA